MLIAKFHTARERGVYLARELRIRILCLNRKFNSHSFDRIPRWRVTKIFTARIKESENLSAGCGHDVGHQAIAVAPNDIGTRAGGCGSGQLVTNTLARVRIIAVTVTIQVHLNMNHAWASAIDAIANCISIVARVIRASNLGRRVAAAVTPRTGVFQIANYDIQSSASIFE